MSDIDHLLGFGSLVALSMPHKLTLRLGVRNQQLPVLAPD
jgi:hypothetical protein